MPRKPSVRYFKSRKAFYTQIDKQQHELFVGEDDRPDGPNCRAAQRAFDRLMDQRLLPLAAHGLLLSRLSEAYYAVAASTLEPSTLHVRTRQLKPFLEQYGHRYACGITPREISGYVAERRSRPETTGRHRRWGPTTATNFLASLGAMLAWGVDQQLILENPARKVRAPGRRSRGRESVLTDEDHRIVIAAASPEFGALALALAHTGARPGELLKAQAVDWDDASNCLIYHGAITLREGETKHKGSRRGKTRRIFFVGEELAKMRERVAKFPSGKLFRNTYGGAWTVSGVIAYILWLKKKVNLPHLICYSWRHTFATRWIKAGKSIEVLAELMGNTPNVIRRHYSHLDSDLPSLRKQLEDFSAVK